MEDFNGKLSQGAEAEIRNDEQITEIINSAIEEVIDEFGGEMTGRDKDLLQSVIGETSTQYVGRVGHLTKLPTFVGASENLKHYINQALQTIREELTTKERERFRTWSKDKTLLDDIS